MQDRIEIFDAPMPKVPTGMEMFYCSQCNRELSFSDHRAWCRNCQDHTKNLNQRRRFFRKYGWLRETIAAVALFTGIIVWTILAGIMQ